MKMYTGKGLLGSIALTNRTSLTEKTIHLKNAFIGLVHMPGARLNLGQMILERIGGDGMNVRDGNFHIHRLTVRDNEVWLTYDAYHQDCALQAYAVKENGYELNPHGVIKSVSIAHVDIEVHGDKSQLIMLSDGGFEDWRIGYKSIRIRCDYPYWFSANTLRRSVLGNLAGNVDIAFNDKPGAPVVRIGDGIAGSKRCIKVSPHRTETVVLIGCGNNNKVPDNVIQV